MTRQRAWFIRTVVVLPIAIVLVWLLVWLWGHGRLNISLPDGVKTVEIISAETNISEQVDTSSLGKTLATGSYTVVVMKDSTSYTALVRIGRFLTGTDVSATNLSKEAGLSFIGDEPRSCPILVGSKLLSYTCNGSADSLVYHRPASAGLPSFVERVRLDIDIDNSIDEGPGTIEGIVTIEDKTYSLQYSAFQKHDLYRINTSGSRVTKSFIGSIANLNRETTYSVFYEGGQLRLLGVDGSQFMGADFDNIQSARADMSAFGDLTNAELTTDFGLRTLATRQDLTRASATTGTTLLLQNGEITERRFSEQIVQSGLCGDYVCALNEVGKLLILGDNLKEVASIAHTDGWMAINNILYAYSTNRLYQIDTTTLSGRVAYSSGYFTMDRVSESAGRIILSLNSSNKTHTVLLDDTDNRPDRLFEPLFKNSFVNTISIYGNRVFVSPELGDPVPSPSGGYDYRADLKAAAKDSIDSMLSEYSDSLKGYRVVHGLENLKPTTSKTVPFD